MRWELANAHSLAKDKKDEQELYLNLAEYIGMFFNAKMAKKLKEMRKNNLENSTSTTESAEDLIKSGKLKDNPLIELYKRMNESSSKQSQKTNRFKGQSIVDSLKDD